ncbi:protein-tyrosine phosphatase-like protein [Mucidula mucida]|nr:protein-tyrosine phosphatase-like protein [Mucidula mucida]
MPPKKTKKNESNSGDAAILVESPYLYLGPKSSASAAFLSSHYITDVLSIGATPPVVVPDINYHRLSLSDNTEAPIEKVIMDASDIITAVASRPAGRVFVHCSAAVSRSPTVVAGYLMAKRDMTLKEALGKLIRARPAICPNPGFLAQLEALEKTIRGDNSLNIHVLPSRKTERVALFSDDN